MSYQYHNTKEELQKAADAGLAVWEAVGIIMSDGAGHISVVPVDNTPTESSTNLISSGAVEAALADKQDTVPAATENDIMIFDANGQGKDSGKKLSDLQTDVGLSVINGLLCITYEV